ncbi:helix-turn-helix domain-containing protein [Propionibacterium australiense]|uniref:XRE family transcriptional regulator n=1 Tax=Propionibacterium australiense TaxID=119981 RepID=A0A8B3FPB1_9ACTN|nr:helix-turn-helix transcriptional regulator [Propionibacterium australiense]RLP12249.1 XRE family transcriptional regulator [Propionibacterium australiense]
MTAILMVSDGDRCSDQALSLAVALHRLYGPEHATVTAEGGRFLIALDDTACSSLQQLLEHATAHPLTMPTRDLAQQMGQNLRTLRRNAQLTQEQLAAEMAARGFESWNKTIVSRVETGKRRLTAAEERAAGDILWHASPPGLEG